MKKILWTLAVAVAMISSCDLNIDTPDNPKDVDPTAVGFNVYVNRGLQTKAGWEGVLTLDDLKDKTKANGFGVFAYYGNGALYNETMMPDFMYDQQVCFTDNNVWEYSPIKYWPNEYGEAASSEAADRLTFFAYAPFADVTPSTGVVTDGSATGIIGMSRNISKGDPVVMYSSSLTPGNGVDLCWGVAAEPFTSSVDGSNNNNVAAGYPFLNVIKPKTGDHLKFEFNHALAQLNVQIDADINNEVAGDSYTKIYVRSVTFNGFSMRGSLNLNSNKTEGPIWYDISGTGKLKREPVTIYDGRTDGMEGVETASDVSEKPASLNPIIVQAKPYGNPELKAGVTTAPVNLFNGALDAPVMVIPTPGVPMSVTIVYDVETEDRRLAGYLSDGVTHGSSVENKITKTITTSESNMILSSGKKYVVKLHLGLTSVRFDADVAVWDNTTYEGSGYLPENTTSLGTVTITDGSSSAPISSLAMWMGETMTTAPTVTVEDENHNPVTGFTTKWTSSDTGVATVAEDGTVTPVAPGTATITVKVTKDGKTSSKSYTMYVNELTGISITSTATDISVGGTLPVKATLEINGGNAVNGDIAPSVTWTSSASAKISITSPVTAVKEGDDYVSTTTATALTPAVLGDQATITASIGAHTDNVTLTCTDSRTVTGVTLGASTTTTVWRCEGFTVPTVTVQGSEDSDLTSLATLTWKVNGETVTETSGVIPLSAAGALTVTVTASYNNSEATSDPVTVYANELTGISVAPESVNVLKGATTTLTASLTKTEHGDVTALIDPTITWSSGSTAYVTVSPATGTSTTASGVAAGGSSTVTASVPSDYMQSGVANSASCTVQCVTPSTSAFRGYEVSPGILYRDKDGNYGLTNVRDGANFNPFELRGYWNTTSRNASTSSSTYYFQFTFLRGADELGADSNNSNNINAGSAKLPQGWTIPSKDIWTAILFGEPKSAITVNDTQLHGDSSNKGAYALARIQSAEDPNVYYPGILLFRDGMNITCTGLNTSKVGVQTASFEDNTLTMTQYNDLITAGCLFITVGGYYSSTFNSWRPYEKNEGYYHCSNMRDSNKYWFLQVLSGTSIGIAHSTTGDYYPVRLIKPKYE